MELPVSFRNKMKALLGETEYSEYEKSLSSPSYRGLRVNTSKISAEEFEKILPFPCVKVPWVPNGFYLAEDAAASKHPYYAAGLYYLQEPSAMTPARTLPISKGDKVLDLCAAPGGKATELSARIGKDGILVANDISNSRAKGLLKNLELFGMPNILVTSETPERLAEYFPEYFDKILIDAPCSGEGMFRKDPSMVKSWLEHGPEYYAAIQKEIIRSAAKMLRPGGMLLYSTCTFDPMENEGMIQYLLDSEPEFSVQKIDCELESCFYQSGFCPGRPDLVENGTEDLKYCFRLYPHRVQGEGHFLALLKKKEVDNPSEKFGFKSSVRKKETVKPNRKLLEPAISFLNLCMKEAGKSWNDSYTLDIHENAVYALPRALPSIRGLRFLRTGCYLGNIEKSRFEPSQALSLVLNKQDWPLVLDISLSDNRVLRYLKGETLDLTDIMSDENGNDQFSQKQCKKTGGWALVCVDGHPLGWGKIVNDMLRNKYYPGWRW